MTVPEHPKFAFIVDGEVFMTWSWLPQAEQTERWIAGLTSNPTIVDISEHPLWVNISTGWTFDGTTFSPPAE